jgi:hypothetical protein
LGPRRAACQAAAGRPQNGHNDEVSRERSSARPGESKDVPPTVSLPPAEREVVAAPPLLGASVGIAVGRRAGRAQVTALVLSLRRRAEAEAQEQLRRVRGQLELARQTEAQAEYELAEASQELQRLRRELVASDDLATPRRFQSTAAQLLASHSERLQQQRQLVRQREHQRDDRSARVATLLQQQGERHTALRLALARREAAELHQTAELREHKRLKAQRQRTLEEEVRDRFLSSQRLAKPPRR